MPIKKINPGDPISQSADLVHDNIDKLKALFPEIVTEGKIDFKVLQQVLGEELEAAEEYYRFTWAGKSQARREAHKPSTGTLRPAKEESLDWDTTENMYIEGDNLEVLKLLQKSYAGKIKMIYIDPPYNTGKDFVYKDNYKDNLKNYQEVTGQIDSDGNKISTNSDADGRYHSNWLNMMYPRLRLARNLLKEDGVIFVSIDENEIGNLRKLCSEIFGEENYLGELIWETATDNNASQISMEHEYIVCFSKNKQHQDKWQIKSEKSKIIQQKYDEIKNQLDDVEKTQKTLKKWISSLKKSNEIDLSGVSHYSYVDEKGVYYPGNSNNTKPGGYNYDILHPVTQQNVKKPSNGWRWPEKTFWNANSNGDVEWGKNENIIPKIKKRLETATELLKSYYYEDNRSTTSYLTDLFGKKVFQNPKSVNLIKKLIKFTTTEQDLILDFFSGSSSTAHSLISQNLEDGNLRNFIQIQLPEPTDEKSEAYKAGYKTISEIGKERIRRVVKKIKAAHPEKSKEMDLGFKVFKLDSSNIKSWDGNPENLNESLFDAVGNIKTDRTEEDVLYEILLKYGLDLTLPIEERIIEGKKVFNVGLGSLFVCLSDGITAKVAEGIGQWKETCAPEICRVIFKDNGFTDVEKTNSVQTLKRYGINEIRSI